MRFGPRSLLWRTFALIALLIVVALAAWVAIFRAAEQAPRVRQTAQMVASVVNLTRTALLTAAPDLRRELLLELAAREGIRIYPAEPGDRVALLDASSPLGALLDREIRGSSDRTRASRSRSRTCRGSG
ncbi:MAG: hypothetical protein M5U08_12855 [Burkholderiales bacterium]|nr:hypothetical protein [Burkholderiales bacterium]